MLVRILSNQIREYEEVINETIDKSIPEYQTEMRSKLFEELLFGTAQCWISSSEGKFEAVILTKIEEDTSCGGKLCILLGGYAPGGTSSASFYAGWIAVSKFALSQGCDRIALFTDNPEIKKYMGMFDKIWETTYYQVRLNKEK